MTSFTGSVSAAEILDSEAIRLLPVSYSYKMVQLDLCGAFRGIYGYEATEWRDADVSRYFGKGVQTVVHALEHEIAAAVCQRTFDTCASFDAVLCALDGTAQKSRLGANALLAASGAFVRAAAASSRLPLFAYLSGSSVDLPVPFMNVINGRHAENQ